MDWSPPSPPPRYSKPRPPKNDVPSLPTESYDSGTEIQSIECWVYESLQRVQFEHDAIRKEAIAGWLVEPPPKSYDEKAPVAGLRLICREQKMAMEMPFDDATLKEIHSVLGIPQSYSFLTTRNTGACGRYFAAGENPVFVYNRSNNNGTISSILKYDPIANLTIGYILLGPRISFLSVRESIKSQFPEFSHPLLIPTLMVELTAADLLNELGSIHLRLADVEGQTGYGDWGKEPIAEMGVRDYHRLARLLGMLDCRFSFMEVAVQCAGMMNDFTLQELDRLKEYTNSTRLRQLKGIMNSSCLKQRVELLASNIKHLEMFGAIRKRMQTQQNVLFNLISQQENILNLEIARSSRELAAASRRDSSSMKIIAVITTLFLPGTFISALFAMPLFDWSALTMGGVVTDRFWVYWAVTVPLTLLIIIPLGFYAWYQTRKHKAAVEEVRNTTSIKQV
ncbi:hypothetical protein F5Y04DRAFT_235340 [Hypomontagnella monticulosa]|nr:hypothetical protein F5Y04DRAFT_235340 [Hypomontagnella monticulosa]